MDYEDYEDYDEQEVVVDTTSSDDIYYDAGQTQLLWEVQILKIKVNSWKKKGFFLVKHFQCVKIFISSPED